jgi:NAD(P)H-dependent FMN reductase
MEDVCGIKLPRPAQKTIDLEGRIVKDGVKKALRERQDALSELVDAIRLYRQLADSKPLTLQGDDYAQAVQRLNAAVDRADGLVCQ